MKKGYSQINRGKLGEEKIHLTCNLTGGKNVESLTFVLFGATGDLAKRKIFPALYNLFTDKKLPDAISIIGSGYEQLSHEDFKERVKQSINAFSRRKMESNEEDFLSLFHYQAVDASKTEDYEQLLKIVDEQETNQGSKGNRLFYLSVAPEYFDVIALHIKKSGLDQTGGWKRLMIEKPFGHDLASARELNEKLSSTFKEEEIYRIDHYLGKPMVQNLEALEFTNPVLQSLWNNKHIANVQITASETVGVENRAGYYDHTGAIRDMIQNHMLQVLMMTAMHLPKRICSENILEEKQKVMESLRKIQAEEVARDVVRGQYGSGEIDHKPVRGYKEEPGVEADSKNDTFVAARLWIDNPFWKGVPFYIRTGKRMKEKSTRIVIEFKDSLKGLYETPYDKVAPNLFIIEISPSENVALQLNSKNPLKNGFIEPVRITFSREEESVPEAYERIIYDALIGDSTFFAHWKEVELSWQWVQPVLDAFEADVLPLYEYPSGSQGPEEAQKLVAQEGFKWWLDDDEYGEAPGVFLPI